MRATMTAAPITSAGRFSPFGPLGIAVFLTGPSGRYGSIVVLFKGKAIVIGLIPTSAVIAFENIKGHRAVGHICPTGSTVEAMRSLFHALNNNGLGLA